MVVTADEVAAIGKNTSAVQVGMDGHVSITSSSVPSSLLIDRPVHLVPHPIYDPIFKKNRQ